MTSRALPVLALLLATACAASPPAHGPGGRGLPPGPPRPRIFVSPAGEQFRGVDGLPRWFDQADSDHDARLTRAEFEADHLRFFRLVDVNGDGVIDGAEVQRYEHDIAPELLSRVDRGEGRFQGRGGPGPGGGRGHGGGRGGGGRPGGGGLQDSPALGLLNEPEPLLAADTDLDFKVTLKEWQAAAADRFARLDAARHGALSLDELRHRPGGSGEARRR